MLRSWFSPCLSTASSFALLVGCSTQGTRSTTPQPNSQTLDAGWLDTAALQNMIRQHSAAFQNCYDQVLAHDPSAGEHVSVRIVLAADGGVGQAESAGGDIRDPAFLQCVRVEFARMVFPAPPREATIVFPLVFSERRTLSDAGGDATTWNAH